ncbi:hypothetical protein Pcinc_018340 [Petrolisthes cinctipes]|uniref:Uncharacterized protein n=1 Tax=Petrolisthes cinctipes TaxID=88211 RepID=A0AAE1KNW5_PETCI|nr:hypothetical protein Pcinc_018340 [Petrolisthes cinctipes]
MSSGRPRQQYGRSATTSYTNLFQDSGGDILNRCSTLFNKFASRVRATSQSGDERVPLHHSTNTTSTTATQPHPDTSINNNNKYPMLLKYSKYDDSPRYADYKKTSILSDVKSKTSKYEPAGGYVTGGSGLDVSYKYGRSGTGVGLRGGHGLAPSASFSSFSTFKSDYGSGDYDKRRYGNSGGRSAYSRTNSDISLISDYGLGSAYVTHTPPAPNYDKIGARYKPSRFLKKSSLGSGRCAEVDEEKLSSAKKTDYWSQYGGVAPSLVDRLDATSRYTNLSPQLRRRHGDGGLVSGTARQQVSHTVTDPRERETTSAIMKRYSGLSTSTRDGDTGSTTSSATPDSVMDEAARRKERAQLISMYSLPLNVLHNIGSSQARKFLKRGQDGASGDGHTDPPRALRFDQVKEMAARVTALSAYQDDDGSRGPPRKVYGSASTGDVLSAIARSSAKGADSTLSQTSTPDSEKYVLYDPPIVFEKAFAKERPTLRSSGTDVGSGGAVRPTTLDLYPSLITPSSTITTTLDQDPIYKSLKSSYSSLLDSPLYGASTPTTPSIKVTNYMEPEHEYTFTTFKPNAAAQKKLERSRNPFPDDTSISYVPALTPKSPTEHSDTITISVKPKTTTTSSTSRVLAKAKDVLDTSYPLAKFKSKVDDITSNGSKSTTLSNSTVPPPPPPKKSGVSDLLSVHDSKRHHFSFCSTSSVSSAARTHNNNRQETNE